MPAIHLDTPSITFLHVPRAAGTSIGTWFIEHYPEVHHWHDHPTLAEIEKEHKINFSFAVVRNPWDRVVSLSHYLKQQMLAIKKSILHAMPSHELDMHLAVLDICDGFFQHDYSFDQFVEMLPHMIIPSVIFMRSDYRLAMTQYDYSQGVDLVLKHETLEQDFVTIQKMCNNYNPLPVINTSQHDHYRTYYNPTTRATIQKLFGEDIEQWKYQF
jgi:hypothetical protein